MVNRRLLKDLMFLLVLGMGVLDPIYAEMEKINMKASALKSIDLIAKTTGDNGGFEKGTLAGWRPWYQTKGRGKIEVITEGTFRGKYAVRIKGEKDGVAVLQVTIEKKHGLNSKRTYVLKFAAKPISGRCRVVIASGPKYHANIWLHRKPKWREYNLTLGFVNANGGGPGKGTDLPLQFGGHLGIQFYGSPPFELLVDKVKLELR